MTSMIMCIMIYAVSTLVFAACHLGFFLINIKRLHIGHFLLSMATFWGFHIFNIIYTGMMGWNLDAATQLEQYLDNITIAGILTSFVMLWRSIKPRRVEKERVS